MQYISLNHPYDLKKIIDEPIVLILGFFDGVHRGHQAVIKKGVEIARKRNIKAALMTFNHTPQLVYKTFNPQNYSYLTPLPIKKEKVAQLGVDIYYEVAFTHDFGLQSPQEFVDSYLVAWHAQVVVAGFDYTYGQPEIASMKQLPEYAKGRFDIVEVPEQFVNETEVSSTFIRRQLSECTLGKANAALGYPYTTRGKVIHGKKRGSRELGYPTANIFSDPYTLIPASGVYVVKAKVKGKWYGGMTSVGHNVTFGDHNPQTVEVYLFDFDQTIYGEKMEIKWLHYLRPEIKFDGAQALIKQLDQDAIISKEWLKSH